MFFLFILRSLLQIYDHDIQIYCIFIGTHCRTMQLLFLKMIMLFALPETLSGWTGNQTAPFERDTILFVAHRGASYLAPENTLASIKLAWELGADGAECDVMMSADHRIILFHDNHTKKLTGVDHTVAKTNWDLLKELRIKPRDTNLPGYENESIPLLEQVLDMIPDDRMLVIEIKTGPEILPDLKQVIDTHWNSGRISFIAFDFETIKAVKALYPEVPCYYLSSFRKELEGHFEAVVEAGLEGVDLRHQIIDQALVDRCHAAGLEVWCWTVNDPETARNMHKMGVSAITTDRPAWLKENMFHRF